MAIIFAILIRIPASDDDEVSKGTELASEAAGRDGPLSQSRRLRPRCTDVPAGEQSRLRDRTADGRRLRHPQRVSVQDCS